MAGITIYVLDIQFWDNFISSEEKDEQLSFIKIKIIQLYYAILDVD